MEPIVAVRGEAVLEVEPEIATLRVSITARDRDRERAVHSLERRTDELRRLLNGFGDAVERVETAAVSIRPQFKDNRYNEKIVGYEATVSTTVIVSEFRILGDLFSELSSQELVNVYGPWWALRTDSDRYRQARVAAAQDAVSRAREYADALGATLNGMVELADVGLLSDAGPQDFGVGAGGPPMPLMAAPAASFGGGGAPPPPPAIDFSPMAQVVRARVEARFTMTPPQL